MARGNNSLHQQGAVVFIIQNRKAEEDLGLQLYKPKTKEHLAEFAYYLIKNMSNKKL